ncbi:MAG: SDR family NAD(P)-dependent oxidoreductase [Syntrophorhabdales bacterium]|jgi:3-oxoacyl-[acyl-carrier protein] reductase
MNASIAVVTGGTRGIGLVIADRLLQRGFSLAITYKDDEKSAERAMQYLDGRKTANQHVLLLRGDAGDPDTVAGHHRTVHGELGPVSVLVNNAGIMPAKSLEEISVQEWDETIRINLSGAFYWCRQVVPGMKEMKFGRIVNISSIAARGGGVIGPHYAASKAGMLGLTRYAARELGPYGVTVNAIAPAFIGDAGIFADWSDERKAILKEKVLVPRLGTSDDVARAFEYLLDSPFVTGVTLDVNGGSFMI